MHRFEETKTMTSSEHAAGRRRGQRPGLRRRLAGVAAAVGLVALVAPATAGAITITDAVAEPVANGRTADPTVAGAHPDLRVMAEFETDGTGAPTEVVDALKINLPPGVVANPQNVPTCTRKQAEATACPPESQVGEGLLGVWAGVSGALPLGVYNMESTPGEPARMVVTIPLLGLTVGEIAVQVSPEGDYAIQTTTPEMVFLYPITGVDLTFWGVPGDHTPAEPKPYVTNPTQCTTRAEAVISASSMEVPAFTTRRSAWPLMTGCESVPFNPSINVSPVERVAGGASKVDVDVMVEQNVDPDGRSAATLKRAVVNLPEGVSINPGMARDLSACTDGAFGLKDASAPSCPAGSKIGTAGLETPLLAEPLPGDVFVGQPLPGNAYRIFVHINGKGTRIKLLGEIRPDPKTGRLSAIFDNNPQLPFSWLRLTFRGGSKSVLAMPATCGSKATQAGFESWAGQSVQRSASFLIAGDLQGGACPETQPFDPTLEAGTTTTNPGGDTGFVLAFGRADRDQALGSIDVRMPAGLLGRLSAFPLCPIDRAKAGACSEDSMVGGVAVSTGAGDALLNLPGRVFLTEAPKPGQVAGLSIVTPAIAGPYDLGTVIVQAGITVNPDTSLRVQSDPLPTVLEGIPLRIRKVVLTLDRPGFMLNPSDCSPKKIGATITSADGTAVDREVPFRVAGCGRLDFEPKMTIGSTKPDGQSRTDLRVDLRVPAGQANMREVNLTLPSGFGARLDGPLQTPCSEADFAKDACQASAKVGTSRAVTPVLPEPLAGDVFFIENPDGLPKLGVRLKGMVTIDVIGHVTVLSNGRVNATFPAIPDVPISEFQLSLERGDRAVLTAANACSGRKTAALQVIAHSGKVTRQFVDVTVDGCTTSKRTKTRR
jgi:hypothetical protein